MFTPRLWFFYLILLIISLLCTFAMWLYCTVIDEIMYVYEPWILFCIHSNKRNTPAMIRLSLENHIKCNGNDIVALTMIFQIMMKYLQCQYCHLYTRNIYLHFVYPYTSTWTLFQITSFFADSFVVENVAFLPKMGAWTFRRLVISVFYNIKCS